MNSGLHTENKIIRLAGRLRHELRPSNCSATLLPVNILLQNKKMLHEFNGYSTKSLPLHRIHYLALLNRMLPFFHKEQPTGILKWELKESYMYMYLQ